MLHPNFVILASIINLVGTAGYISDTVKGKTQPNRVSWLLWALAPLIAFFAQLGEGVGIQSLMTFTVGFAPLLVFAASFLNRKAVWELSKFDYVCGGLSLVGLVLWLLTQEGNLAIVFAIAADGLAAVPTVVKSFKDPESESSIAYAASGIGALITLATIDTWNFAHFAFPLYIFSVCALLYALIQFKLGRKLTKREAEEQKIY